MLRKTALSSIFHPSTRCPTHDTYCVCPSPPLPLCVWKLGQFSISCPYLTFAILSYELPEYINWNDRAKHDICQKISMSRFFNIYAKDYVENA